MKEPCGFEGGMKGSNSVKVSRMPKSKRREDVAYHNGRPDKLPIAADEGNYAHGRQA